MTWDNTDALKLREDILGDGESILDCPVCHMENTHLEEVRPHRRSTDGNNRLCCDLHFTCEEGHPFVVIVNQHKGFTFLQARGTYKLDS